MTNETRQFEHRIARPLRAQRRWLRVCVASRGAGRLTALLVGAFALQLLVDWWLRLPRDMRAVSLVSIVVLGVVAAWRWLIAPLRLRMTLADLANANEKKHPEWDGLLVSAVQFQTGGDVQSTSSSPALVQAAVQAAMTTVDRLDWRRLINVRPARRGSLFVAAGVAVVAGAFYLAPEFMGIWFDRNVLLADVAWPKRTRLIVENAENGVIQAAYGDDVEVRAFVPDGFEVPRQVEIVFETTSGKIGAENMTGVGERGLRYVFDRAREELRFRLAGGDDETEWYSIRLSERPTLLRSRLIVEPPSYTGLPAVELSPDRRVAEMYPGSTLRVRAEASKPIVSAHLLAGTEIAASVEIDGVHLQAAVMPPDSQTYHFELVDEDGLQNTRPVRFSARLLKDEAPRASLKLLGVGTIATLAAQIPVEAEFGDDLGLAEVELLYSVAKPDAQPQEIPLTGFNPTATDFDASATWRISETGAAVGEQLTILARAVDFNDVSGPGVGESASITFRLVDPEELLADLARREQEYRRQFERLVDSQERLRRDLVTLLGRMNEPDIRDNLEVRLAPMERRQRQIAAQVSIIRQQFTQVLRELEINQLDDADTRDRISNGVVSPLTSLGGRLLPEAADHLRQLGRSGNPNAAARIDPEQADLLERMRAVLDRMTKWEGYQETVMMMREILQLQRDLNTEVEEEVERRAGDLFDDE